MRVLTAVLIFVTLFSAMVAAQTAPVAAPIADRRTVYEGDTDFYGGDLRSIFGTSLEICEQVCLADAQCRALTYNTRAAACFLKSDIQRRDPYVGALSARVIDTPDAVLRRAADRAAALRFLDPGDVAAAARLAAQTARSHPDTGVSPDDLLAQARAMGRENPQAALTAALRAAAIADTAAAWRQVGELALSVPSDGYSDRERNLRTARGAAINAYLRSAGPQQQAATALTLAAALEAGGEGRASIPALRLSLAADPNPATEAALDRALGLFGFRVVDTRVESDAQSPRVCLTFSEPLIGAGFDYTPYVRLDSPTLAVEADGRDLCIAGFAHGTEVALALREGLPSLGGETMRATVEQAFYIRDRSPAVRFLGRAYVLPRSAGAAIPVVTVNTDTVDLAIHRVLDRNLVAGLREGLIGAPVPDWQTDRIEADLGEAVWQGTGVVASDLNRDVTTALPVGAAVRSFAPGVYAMTASIPGTDSDGALATQWFIVTDLGLATMEGGDGLHAFVRGLSDAAPRAGLTLELLARNNAVLGTVQTDATGYGHFPAALTRGTDGNAPALLIARDDTSDFAYLDLTEAGFDLSDRGVEGRPAPQPVDVFVTTERGVYRPGETVHATILARDIAANAITGLPLTAIVIRPDGVEFSRAVLADAGAGGRVHHAALPETAQRGTWRLRLFADPEAPALGEAAFLVEDFVPERIDFTLDLAEGPVRLTDRPLLSIAARYLYGAPGADLVIEGETRLTPVTTLPGHEGYVFGPHDGAGEVLFASLDPGLTTDAAGNATVMLPLAQPEAALQAYELTALVRLSDASRRPVERRISRPVAPAAPLIGVRPLFDDVVAEGGTARFAVIAVAPDLDRTALGGVQWALSRVRTEYQWYKVDGRWNFEPVTSRERVANGTLTLTPDSDTTIEAAVTWGEYELSVTATDAGHAITTVPFSAGWYAAGSGTDTPDRLDVGLDRDTYAAGDTATVRIDARAAGQVLLTVVGDSLIDMRMQAVEAGVTEIVLPVTAAWHPGAYVVASLIRPMDTAEGRNPARALGLGWVGLEPGPARLEARFTSPPQARPRRAMTATLAVDGVTAGETVHATIAAVDVGILNITGFATPDPVGHYLGQRRLSMDLRDVYGRLIDGNQGTRGSLRSGGDDSGGSRAGPPPTEKLVAFFEGPLTAAADGTLGATFDIPDFNGTVRLMAVVWSRSGVGRAEQEVVIRDPVVVTASLPRFLAPGDSARLRLDLANVSAPPGAMVLEVTGADTLPVTLTETLELDTGARASRDVALVAGAVGDAAITVHLTLADGTVLQKDLTLGIRLNDPVLARQDRFTLGAGDGTITLDATIFAGLAEGTGEAVLAAGPLAHFDVPGLLSALDAYPYGCTEQQVSRALPLLYFRQVAVRLGLAASDTLDRRIADAVTAVLANQARNGSFGLWSPDGDGDLWLDAHVTDFLTRARDEGHVVPERALQSALRHLQNAVNTAPDFESAGQGLAYALYTLAREGRAAVGDLRYYADARADAFATPLAKAQLGAALAAYGDASRADAMFRRAAADLQAGDPEEGRWRPDYGTALRDQAAVLTLAAEAGSDAIDRVALAGRVASAVARDSRRSTQENLWTLLAARALISDSATAGLSVDGRAVTGPVVERTTDADLRAAAVTVTNAGAAVDAVLTVLGVPTEPEPAQGNGYRITRDYYTLAGDPADTGALRANDRLVTVLTITPERDTQARLMIDDPLPAGLEIENPNLLASGDVAALDWLDLRDVARHAEFQADVFRAAVDWSGAEPFRLGYLVRAISPGDFHHPAASVEDMYRPAFRARTGAGRVTIAP